jgi:hypothetical protein
MQLEDSLDHSQADSAHDVALQVRLAIVVPLGAATLMSLPLLILALRCSLEVAPPASGASASSAAAPPMIVLVGRSDRSGRLRGRLGRSRIPLIVRIVEAAFILKHDVVRGAVA